MIETTDFENIEIDTNPERLDFECIYGFLTTTCWAKNRTRECMQTCIQNSLNFGVYLNNKQIGYARVVSDYAVFAYIMDVFIIEEYRKRGYSKKLMEYMLHLPAVKKVPIWRLATTDAHGLYEQFGFKPLENPDKMMEWIK